MTTRESQTLPGRSQPIPPPDRHLVLGTPYAGSVPEGFGRIFLGMGCFWGAERLFWKQAGVWRTAVGYAGGSTPNPTYREVCSGHTGHCEVVDVVFDPADISLDTILRLFWEGHDPTQGMRQGNDVGTQYRSAIYTQDPADYEHACTTKASYGSALERAGRSNITTEIRDNVPFYFAEPEHQQYLHTHPNGYCGLAGTGVTCPV